MKKLYDTCSLLNAVDILFDNPEDEIIISSITLSELEAIKNSKKDFDVKHAARRLTSLLDANEGKYEVRPFRTAMLNDKDFVKRDLEINNDAKILATALDYAKELYPDKLHFITNDLSLKALAKLFDKWLVVSSVQYTPDDYAGYIEIICDEEKLTDFYQDLKINHFNLLINQYVILKNAENEVIDTYCWTGEENRRVSFQTFRSAMFGEVKPLKGDVYQTLLADSLAKNRIT